MPEFHYFLYSKNDPVFEGGSKWDLPLPMGRDGAADPGSKVLLKDYFSSCRFFLEKDGFEPVKAALEGNSAGSGMGDIDVCLEKHGEFYHPARVDVATAAGVYTFVLDVGISEAGRACATREYSILKRLDEAFSFSYLPSVYAKGEVSLENGFSAHMFLGDWFDDYHEFHVTAGPDSGKRSIVVWDAAKGNFLLTREQATEAYTRAAKILTSYYNFETQEEIFPWRHAAGDFVLRLRDGRVSVRLVTVRQYAVLFGNEDGEEDSPLHSLFMFFLNMTLFMRLDRLDGVGEVVWSDDFVLKAALEGFFQGLPDFLGACIRGYLELFDEDDIFDFSESLVSAYNPNMPEVPVLKKNLRKHAQMLKKRDR